VGDDRHAPKTYGHPQLAGSYRSEPALTECIWGRVPEQSDRHRRLQQRFRKRRPAGLLHQQDQIDLVQPKPPLIGGRREANHAHLGQATPALGRPPLLPLRHRPQVLGGAFGLQELAKRLGELSLLGLERKPHAGQPFGKPRIRSAMTFRWISLVPA
jgi:hypothetical protein